ncbi:TIGR03943 family putative permease subunit [Streptomyces seoulensis]|uniref:TIGR03943 family putative permease subunit n=1 Tax=Streptomyces seoulensis TaxID=73044 RepID=UPI00364C013C
MNRQAQAAVMFLLGGALLHAGTTDLYLRYVKSGLRPLVLAAGVVLVVAALATVWYEWKRAHGGGGHPEPGVAWLLVLPVLALILIAPPALGSYSAVRTGTALQPPYGLDPLPASDPVRLSVVDYASRAAYTHSLRGRTVRVTGFLALDAHGTPYLARMALNCCAADAQPVKIGLTGRLPPILRPDAWLEVTGVYASRVTRDPVNNGPIPYLRVTSALPVATPADPYDETWNK